MWVLCRKKSDLAKQNSETPTCRKTITWNWPLRKCCVEFLKRKDQTGPQTICFRFIYSAWTGLHWQNCHLNMKSTYCGLLWVLSRKKPDLAKQNLETPTFRKTKTWNWPLQKCCVRIGFQGFLKRQDQTGPQGVWLRFI